MQGARLPVVDLDFGVDCVRAARVGVRVVLRWYRAPIMHADTVCDAVWL